MDAAVITRIITAKPAVTLRANIRRSWRYWMMDYRIGAFITKVTPSYASCRRCFDADTLFHRRSSADAARIFMPIVASCRLRYQYGDVRSSPYVAMPLRRRQVIR